MELAVRPTINPILDAAALAKAYKEHEEDGLSWEDIAARLAIGRHALQRQLRKAGYQLATRHTSGPRRETKDVPKPDLMRGFNPLSQDYLMRKLT